MEEGVRMRTKVISYVICALIIATVFFIEGTKDVSAQVTEEWVARYNGPDNGYDDALAMAVDNHGNIFVTGWSKGDNITFYDYATVAYDSDGNELWSARYNGPGNGSDRANAIAVDDSGNVYVTGKSDGDGRGDRGNDYTTIKYDKYGNELWVARYNGPGNRGDNAMAIAIDDLGNVFVTGYSDWASGIAPDIATVAYDSYGNELWVAIYDAGASYYGDIAFAIAVDSSGNIYVAGQSYTGSTKCDFITVAYDIDGNELWVARYNGSFNGDDTIHDIAIDSFGNVYVTGTITTGYIPSVGSFCEFTTIAYNSSGNIIWLAKYDGQGNQHNIPTSMAIGESGNIYVTGYTRLGKTDYDYATVAYDSNGNELWNVTYDGPKNDWDQAFDIAIDPSDNIYVTGWSRGIGTHSDYATIAYDANGNELWIERYDGTGNYDDWARAIATDLEGNVYVTGRSFGAGTSHDYTTIKYSPPVVKPTVDIDPNTLNLKSKGRWITCYIDLLGYDVNDIDINTVILEDTIPAEWGDIQGDTLMVKFDRSEVEDMLSPGTYNLKVTGELTDGTEFEGYSDEIRVIDPGK